MNRPVVAQIGALMLATSSVQLAVGFFGTFISLRVPLENFRSTMSALVLAGYYAGYTIGAVYCSRIIERVGHIRAYAALASLAVVATAVMSLAINGPTWLSTRCHWIWLRRTFHYNRGLADRQGSANRARPRAFNL
jgi:MFS family permease